LGEKGSSSGGADGIFDSALRFKDRAPLIDSLLRDLGLEVISLDGALTKGDSGAKKKADDKKK
jgi:hypothetical protein